MCSCKKFLITFVILLVAATSSYTQGVIEADREPDNYAVHLFGGKLNSHGYGLYYRFSKSLTDRLRGFIESEYNYQFSLKEIKIRDSYVNKSFVFGKTHSVHNFKLGLGGSYALYQKRDKNSISIHATVSGGAIFGFSKPIYYEVIDSLIYQNGIFTPYSTKNVKFDPNVQSTPLDILSKAPFLVGLDEVKFHPGMYIKAGVLFDFSRDIQRVKALEAGVVLDYYIRPVEIMSKQQNSFFFSVYIAYYFGGKYNPQLNKEYRKEQRRQNIK